MTTTKLAHLGSFLFLSLLIIGNTIGIQVWADRFEGTDGPDIIIGTPEEDMIDSKGGEDINIGDTVDGDATGNDRILSGMGNDISIGDSNARDGSGDDTIVTGQGDDTSYGDSRDIYGFGVRGSGNDRIITGPGNDQLSGGGGADTFVCGSGEDIVTDYNPNEGDRASRDCENIS